MQRGRIISFSCKLCNFHFYFCATTKCIFCKVQKSFFPFKITHLISNLKPSCVCNHLFLPDFLSFKHQDFPYVKARKCPSRQIKKKEKKKRVCLKGKKKAKERCGWCVCCQDLWVSPHLHSCFLLSLCTARGFQPVDPALKLSGSWMSCAPATSSKSQFLPPWSLPPLSSSNHDYFFFLVCT